MRSIPDITCKSYRNHFGAIINFFVNNTDQYEEWTYLRHTTLKTDTFQKDFCLQANHHQSKSSIQVSQSCFLPRTTFALFNKDFILIFKTLIFSKKITLQGFSRNYIKECVKWDWISQFEYRQFLVLENFIESRSKNFTKGYPRQNI